MLADPDHDGANNLMEFGFATDPLNPNSRPAVGIMLENNNLGRLRLNYTISSTAKNVIIMPQVTENLSLGKWRFDPFALTTEMGSDPARLTITAQDNPSGIPQQRFARVMVALDSDGDMLPDDWEIANGLSAFDATDHFNDVDGDGDTAWQEFLQGTDPLNAQSNSAQFRIPRTPLDALVVGIANFQLMWRDVSDNETTFRIYDGGTLVGTVAPDETVFQLPATITTAAAISLTATNSFGESPHAIAQDRTGGADSPLGDDEELGALSGLPNDIETSEKLGVPTIGIRRMSPQTVRVGWKVGPILMDASTLSDVKIRILKQAQMQEWQTVEDFPYLGNETGFIDIPAPAGTTWRFSATTIWEFLPTDQKYTAASDGAVIQIDDYVASLFGTKITRGFYDDAMPPIGELLQGAGNYFDVHTFSAKSFDGRNPSFLQTNPAITTFPHPHNFSKEPAPHGGKRWPNAEGDTWVSYGGLVVRGRDFNISAELRASHPAPTSAPPSSILRLDTDPKRLTTPEPQAEDYGANPLKFKLPDTKIHNPTVTITGDENKGFDPVTYFASQTMAAYSSAYSERTLDFTPSAPTSTPFNYLKTGPITINSSGQQVIVAPDTNANAEAIVDLPLGDAEGRKAKIQLLQKQTVKVSMHRVYYADLGTGLDYAGPELLDEAALSLHLNKVFFDQAAVEIVVLEGNPIVILSTDLPAPLTIRDGKPEFTTLNLALQLKLWQQVDLSYPSNLKPDLALFFVPGLKPNTFGEAFATPSRAALIGDGANSNFGCAHEMGHCFGLRHAPNGKNPSGLPILPDRRDSRLMGYGGGQILRFKEAQMVNAWRSVNATQPGQFGP